MGDARAWGERDASVVWHGFTQMSCYLDNEPIIVAAGEERELIDVDGRRYLDAISSLWVTTLGHRVPELDRAVRDQLDLIAHSTLLGNGNRVVVELAEALAGVVPVDGPHFLFASDGAAAVEQALKIAFQYWVNLGVAGRTRYLALGHAYHGDTVGSLSVGAGGFGTDLFDPLRFDVVRAPGYDDPRALDAAADLVDRHGGELAAVVIEPLGRYGQGARPGRQLRPAARRPDSPAPRGRRRAPARTHGRRRARASGRRAPLGPPGLRRGRAAGRSPAAAGRRCGAHAAAHHHRRRDRAHRRRPGGVDRRGDRVTAVDATRRGLTWSQRVAAELDSVRAAGRWRVTRDVATTGPVAGTIDGREVVTFASNDYLGLTHHPAVVAAAHDALDRWGAGSGASRLVVGSRPLHSELEAELATWKGTEAALLFPTGYAANLGLLATLGGPDVAILSDELNNASIVDGCRLARARVRVFRHADVDHVAALLRAVDGPALVVTDSAFSMDGDVADVAGLVVVCARHGALLVLDEAHAVLGPDVPPAAAGRGAAGDAGAVVRVGTLSKALGSLGGFVAGARPIIDLLRNRARPFIFTTAPTPADVAAALAAVRLVRSDEGRDLVARLRRNVDRMRASHPTPIVPVVLGDEVRAMVAADDLLDQGLLVPAIRPPTVPAGTSRLRIALSAAHTDDQLDRLATALHTLGEPGGAGPA